MGVCWVGKSEIGFKKYLHFLFNQCLYWFAACKDTKIRNVFYVGLIITIGPQNIILTFLKRFLFCD